MSIYPVKLMEWFPHPRKRKDDYENNDHLHWTAKTSVKYAKCLACGKQPKWNRAIGHHSIPWGNGDIWCSEKCLDSGKRYSKVPRQKKLRGSKQKHYEVIFNEIFPNAKQNQN